MGLILGVVYFILEKFEIKSRALTSLLLFLVPLHYLLVEDLLLLKVLQLHLLLLPAEVDLLDPIVALKLESLLNLLLLQLYQLLFFILLLHDE